MLLFVLFFSMAVTVLLFMLGSALFADTSDLGKISRSKQALLTAEALAEDVAYRRIADLNVDTNEQLDLGGVVAYATTTFDNVLIEYRTQAEAEYQGVVRRSEVVVGEQSVDIDFGLLAGTGGINMENSVAIYGDVYANGPVIGANSAEIFGNAISAGPTGLLEGVSATGSVYAHTIDDINVEEDAYYTVQAGASTVWGTRYTPSPDMPYLPLPLSDSVIQQWKDDIVNTGTTIAATDPLCSSGTYTIDGDTTIGWLKIECDLSIRKTGAATIVTLNGPVWVEGNLEFRQGPEIRVDAALGRYSAQFIVDNEANRTTSSKIVIRNSTDFYGSGDSRSYVLLLSMNEDSSLGGAEDAIEIQQSANGRIIAYSADGSVVTSNGIDLIATVGHIIDLGQSSSVTYDVDVSKLFFPPAGNIIYELEDWQQIE